MNSEDHEFQVERFNNLFHFSQTKEVRKTCLNVARRDFYEVFVAHASWQRQIKWTKGGYVYPEDGDRYWDDRLEKWDWRTYKRKVSLGNLCEHQTGKEIFGILGGQRSYFLLIDLDLHNQPLDLFKIRLRLLLDRFHGKHRCHFQVADKGARGVHIILFFGTAGVLSTRLKWLLRELSEIDETYPSGQFIKTENSVRKFNIEVYPNISHAVRLPLARHRKMLLDKPLALTESRGKSVQDVVSYMDWLKQEPENRTFMPKADVLEYVMDRLDLSCAASSIADESKTDEERNNVLEPEQTSKTPKVTRQENLPLKGKTRKAIVGFWQNGEETHFLHLNSAINTTLGALQAEGMTEDDAVDVVFSFAEDIPNKDISSRLTGDLKAVHKEITRNAKRIWANPANSKWELSVACWQSYGFRVSDKSTWSAKPLPPEREEVVVDCEEITFNQSERDQIVKKIAPLLVGKKQANKKEKQNEVERAVAYFLRYVRCCPREIPYKHVGDILSDFRIKWGNDQKKGKFLRLLVSLNWIYVKSKPFHPVVGVGRATAYGIGAAMAEKFSLPLPSSNNKQGDLFISSTFWKGRDIDHEIDELVRMS